MTPAHVARAVQDVLTANSAAPPDEWQTIGIAVCAQAIAERAAELAGAPARVLIPFTDERVAAANEPGALRGAELPLPDHRTPAELAHHVCAIVCSFWDWPGEASNAELVYRVALGALQRMRVTTLQRAIELAVSTDLPSEARDIITAEFKKIFEVDPADLEILSDLVQEHVDNAETCRGLGQSDAAEACDDVASALRRVLTHLRGAP